MDDNHESDDQQAQDTNALTTDIDNEQEADTGPTQQQQIEEFEKNQEVFGTFLGLGFGGYDMFEDGNGRYTDVVIRCGTQELKAHKIILMARCPFFRACLSAGFKETEDSVITMNGDDPIVCKAFIKFLYTLCIKPLRLSLERELPRQDWSGELEMVTPEKTLKTFVVEICDMADKYDVPAIFAKVADYFDRSISFHNCRAQNIEAVLAILKHTTTLHQSTQLLLLQRTMIKHVMRQQSWEYLKKPIQVALKGHDTLLFQVLDLVVQDRDETVRTFNRAFNKEASWKSLQCPDCEEELYHALHYCVSKFWNPRPNLC